MTRHPGGKDARLVDNRSGAPSRFAIVMPQEPAPTMMASVSGSITFREKVDVDPAECLRILEMGPLAGIWHLDIAGARHKLRRSPRGFEVLVLAG